MLSLSILPFLPYYKSYPWECTDRDDKRRFYSLDALRGSMMMLGIVLHGSQWYISEPPGGLPVPKDPSTAYVFDVIVHFIRSFRMPLFIVLAGFFTSLLDSYANCDDDCMIAAAV